MSVSVLPSRNNDNWVANAVVNFVGPLIGDWIKSERDKELNRKQNVAIAQTIQNLTGGNNYPVPSTQNSGLTGGAANGWENSFRQSDNNPLTEFDANTASIAPNIPQNTASAQTQNRIPTPAEFLQTMAQVVGSDPKRFGLINQKTLQDLAAPYIAAYQADLSKQERQTLADKYAEAADLAGKRDVLMGGAIQGIVPYDAPNNVQEWYKYDNPYSIPGSLDAGGEVFPYAFNPREGSYDFPIQINKSLSPQQRQQGEQWDREYGLKLRQQDFLEEQTRFAREHPELKPAYGQDGTLYYFNPYTGETTHAVTPDGEIVKVDAYATSGKKTPAASKSNSGSALTVDDRVMINSLNSDIKQHQIRLRALEKQLRDPSVSATDKQAISKDIEGSEHTPALRSGGFLFHRRLHNNSQRATASYILSTGVTSRMTYGSYCYSFSFLADIYRCIYISVMFCPTDGTFPFSYA